MRELYEKIVAGVDRRSNLIALKKELKDDASKAAFLRMTGRNLDPLMRCLVDEDPKVRKNVATILGSLHCQDALDVLMDSYLEEEQLFVRPEYVTAMSELDCREYLPDFHERLNVLLAYDAPEEQKKHVQAEIHALQELILKKEGIRKHRFTGYESGADIILTTLPAFRDELAAQISGRKKLLKAGVRTTLDDLNELLGIRVWQELLLLIDCGTEVRGNDREVAEILASSDLVQMLGELHEGEFPFYFRTTLTGMVSPEEKSERTRKMAALIEQSFPGKLFNSASNYEVEIRLNYRKDGSILPMLKLFTIPDHRFSYRKYQVAAGMKPYLAAGLMALAKPYLKEHAQVLDPFCGAGTLLLERLYLLPARSSYGIDTFGEAIEKARANAKSAGIPVNYINRDYFDFSHSYLFDEIVTELPCNLTKEETDPLYRRFLEKSEQILTEQGRIVLYTKESNIVKKYLRILDSYRLVREFTISEKSGISLMILERKHSGK